MASSGDVLRVIVSSELGQQLVQNVYHYVVSDIIGSGATEFINNALRSQWLDVVLDLLKLVQADQLQYTEIEVLNLNDVAGDVVQTIAETGSVASDFASSLLTWSFLLRPEDKSIRHGRKGVAGVPDNQLIGNDPSAGVLSLLTDLGAGFADVLNHPNATFTPVVARILPASVRPFVPYVVPIAEGIFKGVGTQYSRKAGRGA